METAASTDIVPSRLIGLRRKLSTPEPVCDDAQVRARRTCLPRARLAPRAAAPSAVRTGGAWGRLSRAKRARGTHVDHRPSSSPPRSPPVPCVAPGTLAPRGGRRARAGCGRATRLRRLCHGPGTGRAWAGHGPGRGARLRRAASGRRLSRGGCSVLASDDCERESSRRKMVMSEAAIVAGIPAGARPACSGIHRRTHEHGPRMVREWSRDGELGPTMV